MTFPKFKDFDSQDSMFPSREDVIIVAQLYKPLHIHTGFNFSFSIISTAFNMRLYCLKVNELNI